MFDGIKPKSIKGTHGKEPGWIAYSVVELCSVAIPDLYETNFEISSGSVILIAFAAYNYKVKPMFSHIMIGANDVNTAKKFYDAVLGTLGVAAGAMDPKGRVVYVAPGGVLMITKPINGEKATAANGGTIGFAATSTKQIDAWHAAGISNSGSDCEDPPGARGGFYLAYLRDPSGNKLCALKQM